MPHPEHGPIVRMTREEVVREDGTIAKGMYRGTVEYETGYIRRYREHEHAAALAAFNADAALKLKPSSAFDAVADEDDSPFTIVEADDDNEEQEITPPAELRARVPRARRRQADDA